MRAVLMLLIVVYLLAAFIGCWDRGVAEREAGGAECHAGRH
jgi:hypothetical protein